MPKRRDSQSSDQSITDSVAGTLKSVGSKVKGKAKDVAKTTKRGAQRAQSDIKRAAGGVYVESVSGGSGYQVVDSGRAVNVYPSREKAERAAKKYRRQKQTQPQDTTSSNISGKQIAVMYLNDSWQVRNSNGQVASADSKQEAMDIAKTIYNRNDNIVSLYVETKSGDFQPTKSKMKDEGDDNQDPNGGSLVNTLFTPAEDPIGESGQAFPTGPTDPQVETKSDTDSEYRFPTLGPPAATQEESEGGLGPFPALGTPPAAKGGSDGELGPFPSLGMPPAAREEPEVRGPGLGQPGGFPELGMPPASQEQPRVPGPGMEEPDANYYEDIFRF